MVAPRIRVENLNKVFQHSHTTFKAIDNLNLDIPPGKITALVGDSGCGKTTLLKLLAGLLKPDSGHIIQDNHSSSPAVMFQDPRLLPWKTVEENLLLALKRTQNNELEKSVKRTRVKEALELVNLKSWSHSYPEELSGGMAQRISLARALCQKKGFLLMDEPFSALDAITREKLQIELKGIQEKLGNTILFITHDISEAIFLADKVCVMRKGKLTGEVICSEGKDCSLKIHKLLGFY
ncbi:ATP-binding cassette domain-containing protein [Oceanispirochaeta crateris]|uniref:ATP-binding cassette domain-containing protein n=1 Tax=Oceanispirochaeta crateris TaxID=2518645 RepID=A0A5C1QP78_9SPIO|nr:ATP-binding cassette domain-containing protein [Oceanispirochaeta crateris]QEN09039.1 ATP-binding cassette domain-containing protein [Oceanispirochaeta crateris]